VKRDAETRVKRLSAQAIEAEVVIRDPSVTWARVGQAAVGLGTGLLFSLVYVPFRVRLDRVTRSGAFRDGFTSGDALLVAGIALLITIAWLLPMPSWLSVGPLGLRFRRWFLRREYRWSVIESFGIGNPSDPRLAYVFVRTSRGDMKAIRLPSFKTVLPADLVESLRTKQNLFGVAGSKAS
jgi:hypothetical protein